MTHVRHTGRAVALLASLGLRPADQKKVQVDPIVSVCCCDISRRPAPCSAGGEYNADGDNLDTF